MNNAALYKKHPNNIIECLACSWYCKIADGKTGVCGVRKNVDGELQLQVYGKAIAAHIDPIEKKPLFHFLPGSKIFSFGTVGCNFACDFCQNWDISQTMRNGVLQYAPTLGDDLSPQDAIALCLKYHLPSIAFTYNEPAIFIEYALDTMKLAKEKGLKTVFVSNGYQSKEAVELLKGNLDAINIDLKAFSDAFYQKVCKARLKPVLENIERFNNAGIWTEVTTLVIPGENDSDKELTQIARFLSGINKDIPWHVTRFHPDYKMLSKTETPGETLKRAYDIGKKAGLRYVYIGNVFDEDHESTYCPECSIKIIKRNWDKIELLNFKDGKCSRCNATIKGIWT